MKKLLLTSLVAVVASSAFAGSLFTSGSLTQNDPTFDAPGASGSGSAVQFYDVVQFTVTATGAYNFEAASPNTSTSTVSNALDTFIVLYENSFDPNSPNTQMGFDDDFTGALSILPGPFSQITATATGFTGAQPSSQLLGMNLTAGNNYYLVMTSFRDSTFVSTSLSGQAVGDWYAGVSGPGEIEVVPEPATMTVLGLAALAAARRRKNK